MVGRVTFTTTASKVMVLNPSSAATSVAVACRSPLESPVGGAVGFVTSRAEMCERSGAVEAVMGSR
jgi:hypothetical protein